MPNQQDNISNLELSNEIRDKNLAPSTKARYKHLFKHFEDWIRTNKADYCIGDNILYADIDTDTFMEFFAEKVKSSNNTRKRTITDESVIVSEYNTYDHVSGYKSAILSYYEKMRIVISADTKHAFQEFFNGYKRKIGELKQDGEMTSKEGKDPLSFSGYRFIARKALEQKDDLGLASFAWCFLLFAWNLIARCVSVSSLMYDHIWWEEDAMVVVFPTQKNDKENKRMSPKHVYANPNNPEICPILAFAVFIWSNGFRRSNSKKTVFGETKDNETRFSTWLRKVLGEYAQDLLSMGIMIIAIGTHSFRKGIATFLSSVPGGPSAIAIYLRAGWSLGAVQHRYIFEGEGGSDQLCGRAASGLCLTEPEFATLPPHFDLSSGEVLTLAEWEHILPGYSTFYPQQFRQVLLFLLASLVHHKSWLEGQFPTNHPLFQSRLWTCNVLDRLSARVHVGVGKHLITGLIATGIPPHILIANQIAELRKEGRAFRDEMIDMMKKQPEELKAVLLENFSINGAMPITYTQVQDMMSAIEQRSQVREQRMLDAIQSHYGMQVNNQSDAQANNAPNVIVHTWSWGGRFHPVPEDFRFPKTDCRKLWDLWWDGNTLKGYGPYRELRSFDLPIAADQQILSRAKLVMCKLIENSDQDRQRDIKSLPIRERDDCFESAFMSVHRMIFPDAVMTLIDKRRIGDVSFITLYDLIRKASKNLQ